MNFEAAKLMTIALVTEHLGDTYDVKFGVAKRTFGSCYYPNSVRKGYIRLSKVLIEANEATHVRDTVLHEIAHALSGHEAGHGAVWKANAAKLGAKTTTRKAGNVADPKYVIYSPTTKELVKRYFRKPNASTIANIANYGVKGRPETQGTLVILTYAEYAKL